MDLKYYFTNINYRVSKRYPSSKSFFLMKLYSSHRTRKSWAIASILAQELFFD